MGSPKKKKKKKKIFFNPSKKIINFVFLFFLFLFFVFLSYFHALFLFKIFCKYSVYLMLCLKLWCLILFSHVFLKHLNGFSLFCCSQLMLHIFSCCFVF